MRLAALAAAVFITAGLAAPADAQRGRDRGDTPTITLFDGLDYTGRSITIDGEAPDLRWVNANDMASSIRIEGGQWEVCLEPDYGGACQVIQDDLPNMSRWAFNDRITSVRAVHRPPRDRREGVTLWSGPNYTGRSLTLVRETDDLRRENFNDEARSIQVHSGSWTLCQHTQFLGRCVELSRSSSDLVFFRMEGRLSSIGPAAVVARRVDEANSGYDAGYGDTRGRVAGGVRGVETVFFAEPEVDGYPVAACADRAGRRCGREAADLACRSAGLTRAVWHTETEAAYGEAYHLSDRMTAQARAVIVDLVCVD